MMRDICTFSRGTRCWIFVILDMDCFNGLQFFFCAAKITTNCSKLSIAGPSLPRSQLTKTISLLLRTAFGASRGHEVTGVFPVIA